MILPSSCFEAAVEAAVKLSDPMEEFADASPQQENQQGVEQATLSTILQQIHLIQQQLARQSDATSNLKSHLHHPQQQPASTPQPPAPAITVTSMAPSKRPKLPDPPRFKGDKAAYSAFEEQLRSKLEVDGA